MVPTARTSATSESHQSSGAGVYRFWLLLRQFTVPRQFGGETHAFLAQFRERLIDGEASVLVQCRSVEHLPLCLCCVGRGRDCRPCTFRVGDRYRFAVPIYRG